MEKYILWIILIISIVVIIGIIFYMVPNYYKKINSSSTLVYNATINSTTPFPTKLNNSNFSRFISNPINNSNVIINNISYPAYHGYSTYYVNKKYIINVKQELFMNSSLALHQFNNIKNNLNQSLSQTNYNSITNKLIKNLSQNMIGINLTISKFSNSYILYALNGTQICSASFVQFTNISFNTPIELLKSTINTCFNS